VSRPSLRTVAPHPCLPLYIKDLVKGERIGLIGWLLAAHKGRLLLTMMLLLLLLVVCVFESLED
jgi:hypothetical protein